MPASTLITSDSNISTSSTEHDSTTSTPEQVPPPKKAPKKKAAAKKAAPTKPAKKAAKKAAPKPAKKAAPKKPAKKAASEPDPASSDDGSTDGMDVSEDVSAKFHEAYSRACDIAREQVKKSFGVDDTPKKPKGSKKRSAAGSSKGKKKRKLVDPNAPKKPQSAFFAYMKDARPAVKDNNPDLSAPEVATQLGTTWRAMSDEDKAPYVEQYTAAKAKYDTKLKAYMETDAYQDFCTKKAEAE